MTHISTLEHESAIDRVFGAILEPQTYRNLAYVLLSAPLAVFLFAFLVAATGFSFSTLIVFIGIPALYATITCLHDLLGLERALLRMAGLPIHSRPLEIAERGLFRRLGVRMASTRTWKEALYVVIHLPVAVISAGVILAFTAASLVLLTAPLTYTIVPLNANGVPIRTLDQAIFFSSFGALLALISTHVINTWVAVWKKVAGALLG